MGARRRPWALMRQPRLVGSVGELYAAREGDDRGQSVARRQHLVQELHCAGWTLGRRPQRSSDRHAAPMAARLVGEIGCVGGKHERLQISLRSIGRSYSCLKCFRSRPRPRPSGWADQARRATADHHSPNLWWKQAQASSRRSSRNVSAESSRASTASTTVSREGSSSVLS